MVSSHLKTCIYIYIHIKNILYIYIYSQIGSFPQAGVKTKMFETHHLVIYHVNLYLEAAAKKEMDFLFKKMHFQQVVAIQCSEEATSMSSKTV